MRVALVFVALGPGTHPEALEAARAHVRPDLEHTLEDLRDRDALAEALVALDLDTADRVVVVEGDCLLLGDVRAFAEFCSEPALTGLVRDAAERHPSEGRRHAGGVYIAGGGRLDRGTVARFWSPRRTKVLPAARGYPSIGAALADPDAFERPDRGRVFGIGLGRTGTTSLTHALARLGYELVHYPADPTTLAQLERGDLALEVLRFYDGLSDDHGAAWFRELDTAFPGSRFVLTTRGRASWLDAMERHWASKAPLPATPEGALRGRLRHLVRAATYRCQRYDEAVLGQVHDEHEAAVRAWFAERPEQLLVLDLPGGQGWPELCRFLDVPVPAQPFPHANRG